MHNSPNRGINYFFLINKGDYPVITIYGGCVCCCFPHHSPLWKHTLHATDSPTKTEILKTINERITYYFRIGMTVLSQRCLSLFHLSIHILLARPMHQRLSWLADISSNIICAPLRVIRNRYLDTDERLLGFIIKGRLIPSLTQFDETPLLRTNTGLPLQETLFIER